MKARQIEIRKQANLSADRHTQLIGDWAEHRIGFINGADWADAHPYWISVEDELPKINPNGSEWEFSGDVIVELKDGDIAVGRYERDNSTGEHYWVLYGVDKDLVVTHWMPLPSIEHFADVSKKISSSEKPNNCKKFGMKGYENVVIHEGNAKGGILKTIDADKVIAWLVGNICDYDYYVKLFKKDFGI